MPRGRGFRADERGGTSIEYALIAALTAIMMVTGVKLIDITMDVRAEHIAAALDGSKGEAVAASDVDDEIITGSIRRQEDR